MHKRVTTKARLNFAAQQIGTCSQNRTDPQTEASIENWWNCLHYHGSIQRRENHLDKVETDLTGAAKTAKKAANE